MRTVRSLALLSLIVVVYASGCGGYGERLTFRGGEVYFTSGVTRDEAAKVGQFLLTCGFFDDTQKSVQMKKEGGTYLLRFVVQPQFRSDPTAVEALAVQGARISHQVLGGAPVEVHLCDEFLKTANQVTAPSHVSANGGNVYVMHGLPVEDGKKLAEFLVREKYFDGNAKDAFLDRAGAGFRLTFVIRAGFEHDGAVRAEFQQFRDKAAREVFDGQPVQLRLCDEMMQTLHLHEGK